MIDEIICGNAVDVLKQLPSNSIDCCITSPPYFQQRQYLSRLGQEDTVDEYLEDLLQVFNEVKRISTGTCWINMGSKIKNGCDLMVPERFALRMLDAGWIKKRTKIWYKPNYFGKNLTDDMKQDFEYVYLFVRSNTYYFNIQYVPHIGKDLGDGTIQYPYRKMYTGRHKRGYENKDSGAFSWTPKRRCYNPKGKQKGSVWQIKTKQFRQGHLSTFPEALIEIPVRAGCPEGGIVLDPFMGSGTVALVALKHRRHFTGCDINPDYVRISKHRIKEVQQELF